MTTYDYYKDQGSRQLYYNMYLSVDNNYPDGKTRVIVESEAGDPFCVRKGVWNIKRGMGWTQYIPEGDPDFDEKADKLVWNKFVAGEKVEEEDEPEVVENNNDDDEEVSLFEEVADYGW